MIPSGKAALLDEAATRTTDESLRARINDDRKRLALLGKPLDLELAPWQGGPAVRLAGLRGHVVVIFFWASWSAPSLRELEELEQVAGRFAGQPVDFLTVSLDKDRRALAATCQAANLRWPVCLRRTRLGGRHRALARDQRPAHRLDSGSPGQPADAERARHGSHGIDPEGAGSEVITAW